jgi:hypothetical protein
MTGCSKLSAPECYFRRMESASDDDLISSIALDVIKFLLLVFVKPHGNVMENTRSVQVTLHVLFAGPDQFHRLPDGCSSPKSRMRLK